jgi:hypothetical protein
MSSPLSIVTQLPWCPLPAPRAPREEFCVPAIGDAFHKFHAFVFAIRADGVRNRTLETSVFTILPDVFIGSRKIPPALYNTMDSSVRKVGYDLDGWGLIPDCGRCFSLRYHCVQTGAYPTFCPLYTQSHISAHTIIRWCLEVGAEFMLKFRRALHSKDTALDDVFHPV